MYSRLKLCSIDVKGYKSFDREGQRIDFGDVTVLIGANGSGKSNCVSFFKLLNYMRTGALQDYIGRQGYADSILHYGSSVTSRMEAELVFRYSTGGENRYSFSLAHASGDTLIFTDEKVSWKSSEDNSPLVHTLGAGHKESQLIESRDNNLTSRIVYNALSHCKVFQFNDTTSTAKVRNHGYIEDNKYLRSNAGNLAAFLYAMKTGRDTEKYYARLIKFIKKVMPQMHDFELSPSVLNKDYIALNWKEAGQDYLFSPGQLSDGSLRFISLAALLLQPEKSLPEVIVLDEPELGLHPSAISALSGMIRLASKHSQVILATQSTRLVDEFDPSEIVVVERDELHGRSVFRRLDQETLSDWLESYSLSEIWEKNVFGGQPG